MIISKVKRIHSYELQAEYKKRFGTELDWQVREFLREQCQDGLYVYDCKKNLPRLRFTFPYSSL